MADSEHRQVAAWFARQFRRVEGAHGPPPGGKATFEEWLRIATGRDQGDVEAGIAQIVDTWEPSFNKRWPTPRDFRRAIPEQQMTDDDRAGFERLLDAATGPERESPDEATAALVGGPDG
ncbi:hypothetical protein HN937_04860, partial [Candidatus Poribacteria bacterium]|nr:hypothetical protein [Candidatus Poribacteria bacterium]